MRRLSEQILIAVDQLVNACLGGWADETISSAAWRKRHDGKGWALLRRTIDRVFFWQTDHCRKAYESELERRHLPKEYRGN